MDLVVKKSHYREVEELIWALTIGKVQTGSWKGMGARYSIQRN